jgi:murein DD-endopeptidase MepM/ murein hydrolase activator NlpD
VILVEGSGFLTAHSRYPHATPAPRLVAERLLRQAGYDARSLGRDLSLGAVELFGHQIPAFAAAALGPRGLRFLLNVATALLVLSLPYSVAGGLGAKSAPEPATVAATMATVNDDAGVRASTSTSARGVMAGSRSIVTVAAEDVRPVVEYKVAKSDTVATIAKSQDVALEDLAYANGITEEGAALGVGQTLMIPPGRGALYFVQEGDTIASVAQKFRVEPAVIENYNRLYFEPEHFATDQLIFVPGAAVPALKRNEFSSISIPAAAQLPARTGRLALPVNGVFTQYFWWGHTGVDLAAPFGTGIMASDDGVVVATGWVAVGGLRVCVQHSGGLQTCYYHTSSIYVSAGQSVVRGQVIAAIGMTGVTTGPHVHWELKVNGVPQDPLAY